MAKSSTKKGFESNQSLKYFKNSKDCSLSQKWIEDFYEKIFDKTSAMVFLDIEMIKCIA